MLTPTYSATVLRNPPLKILSGLMMAVFEGYSRDDEHGIGVANLKWLGLGQMPYAGICNCAAVGLEPTDVASRI